MPVSSKESTRQCILKHECNEKNHASTQHINLYKHSEVTASIIKYISRLIIKYFQELINNLLNLQTTNPVATNKSYQKI